MLCQQKYNYFHLIITSPHLRADKKEFYTIGSPIKVVQTGGYSNSPQYKSKFSDKDILNTFSQEEEILLFETEQIVNRTITHLDCVIFKVKIVNDKQTEEINIIFRQLEDVFKNNYDKYTEAEVEEIFMKSGSRMNALSDAVAIKNDGLEILSATISINAREYNFNFNQYSSIIIKNKRLEVASTNTNEGNVKTEQFSPKKNTLFSYVI